MHVVIPAAGEGRRFAEAGYTKPKPLIDVLGVPMIERVIENVAPAGSQVTVVSQVPLPIISGDVLLTTPTGGAVETILRADIGHGPLIIANCDQLTTLDEVWFVRAAFEAGREADGVIATFPSTKPHHSYVLTDEFGWITDIAEKHVISTQAVAGVYYFKDGRLFRNAAEEVVKRDSRVLGEFYVSSVIAELLRAGARFRTCDTDVAVLGTPEELQLFLSAARVAAAL